MRQLKINKSITNRQSAALDKYLVEIGREELISTDEEVELAQRIHRGGPDGQAALDRLTRANLRFQSKLTKAIVSFEQEFERRPSVGELAELLDTDVSKVQEALGTNGKKVSVDAPFAEDDSNCLIDIMTDDSAPGTDNQMEKESLSSDLDAALKSLNDRERQVLKMLFGIGRNEMTAEEVANTLNLTRERVRQIKERALRRLREADNIKILMKYLG